MTEQLPKDQCDTPISDTPKTDAAQVVATYEGLLGNFVGAAFARQLERDIARLRDALQMIADGTVCPEAFPEFEGAELEAMTARLIATTSLEKRV